MSAELSFVLSQYTRVTDGQTALPSERPRCIQCSPVKTTTNLSVIWPVLMAHLCISHLQDAPSGASTIMLAELLRMQQLIKDADTRHIMRLKWTVSINMHATFTQVTSHVIKQLTICSVINPVFNHLCKREIRQTKLNWDLVRHCSKTHTSLHHKYITAPVRQQRKYTTGQEIRKYRTFYTSKLSQQNANITFWVVRHHCHHHLHNLNLTE